MNAQQRLDALLDSLDRYCTADDYTADPQPFLAAGTVLIEFCRDPEPHIRELAVRALGAYAVRADQVGAFAADLAVQVRLLDALAAALTDTDWGTRQSAAEMLIGLDRARRDDAMALLIADLEADDPEIRLGAAYSLARTPDAGGRRAGHQALLHLMGHWQQQVSAAAALALAELGDRHAIPALQAALYSPLAPIRLAARAALQRLGAGM